MGDHEPRSECRRDTKGAEFEYWAAAEIPYASSKPAIEILCARDTSRCVGGDAERVFTAASGGHGKNHPVVTMTPNDLGEDQ